MRLKHVGFVAILVFSIVAFTTGCNLTTPTPTVQLLVDSFFSGYAYLDVNGNGELDSEDTPLENAVFIVTLKGGYETGDTTDDKGNAFITIPGGVEYLVTLRMKPPKDSNLKLIGPTSVTYPSDTPAKFLFSK